MPSGETDSSPGRAVIVLLCGGVVMTSWPLAGASRVDMGLIEGLARLQLTARRLGCSVQLHHPGPELAQLLALSGLAGIVPAAGRADPPTPAAPD